MTERKKILLAEDEHVAGDALARILTASYDVIRARDGLEGVRLALATPPDLILTDVAMPNLDGLAMARTIRAKLGRKIPLIVMTAHGRPADVVAGIQAGAKHYLVKPIDVDDLERKVKHALE